MPPRLIRRRPLSERIMAAINPMDFLLWLSEEIETRDWNSKLVGTQIGLAMNFAFLLSRANSGTSPDVDDVFGEAPATGWLSFFTSFLVWILAFFSVANASYAMFRKRHYRLFEVSVEKVPETPSAKRVRVQSSPISSSPLRFLTDMVSPESAESRAHPDQSRDVWELGVWDPLPACLRLFCLFSPGHVLVYMLFLPLLPLDPRPSVTVFNCVVLQLIMSVQLVFIQSRFSQQIKDTAIIQREVLHEYDTKFVRPRLHPVVRDVGTQLSMDKTGPRQEGIVFGTPTTVIHRDYQVHPNPNYVKHVDPDGVLTPSPGNATSSGIFTPSAKPRYSDTYTTTQPSRGSHGMRQSTPVTNHGSGRASTTATTTTTGTTYGGSLGVYSHANSPLKKATSMDHLNGGFSPRNSRELAAIEQRGAFERSRPRGTSPLKDDRRQTTSAYGTVASSNETRSSNPFASTKSNRHLQERFPTRW